jgi:hypothetical protein
VSKKTREKEREREREKTNYQKQKDNAVYSKTDEKAIIEDKKVF